MGLTGAFLNLADSVAIIIFTPVIDRLFVPGVERMLQQKVSLNMKIYVGIAAAIGSQLVAAFLEYLRKDAEVLDIPSRCAPLGADGEHVRMSSISVFWMAIPYALIGIGEVLVNPVLQHYAYSGAPESMRSMLQAFNLFAMGGMPNAISAGLSMATQTYTPNNLNNGNLAYVYFINAAFGVLGGAIFYFVSSGVGKGEGKVGTVADNGDCEKAKREVPDISCEAGSTSTADSTAVEYTI